MPDQNRLWPQKDTDCLLHLWHRYSASQIGSMLGRTRSAICGKISRMRRAGILPGGSGKDYVVNPRPPPKPPPPPKPRPMKPKPEPETWYEIMRRRAGAPAMRPCRLLDLPHNGRCRWPLGPFERTATMFCGGRTMPQQVYCPYHTRISYPHRKDGEP